MTRQPPAQQKRIERISETVDPDAMSSEAASNQTKFVGRTIFATASFDSDQNVTLELNTKYSRLDSSRKSKLAGLNTQNSSISIDLAREESLILGGFRSKRMQATSKKIPVLSSIPMIGGTFKSQSTTAVESERFILATTRVVQPE